jgi:hypothetical protein
MAIIRGPLPQDRFFIIDRAWARDWRLSLKEKGALMYICSHHEAYDLTTEQMIAENEDGRDSVLSALRGLEAKGYLVRVQRRLTTAESGKARAGTFNGYDYQLTQPPPCPARPKSRRTRKGKVDTPAEGGDASPQVGTVGGLSGDGEPDSGSTAPGESAPKRDQGLEDQGLGDHPPPPPAARPPTQRQPGRVGEGDSSSTDERPAADAAADPPPTGSIDVVAAELRQLRPSWSLAEIVRAVRAEVDSGLPLPLVAEAARICYTNPTTRHPNRLATRGPHETWWDQAAARVRAGIVEPSPERRRREACGRCDPAGWVLDDGPARRCGHPDVDVAVAA